MAKIAILGYGTVGSGIVEVMQTNEKSIYKKANQEIIISHVLDLRQFPGSPIEDVLTNDFEMILNDPDVDVIAEVMGGVEPAYTFVKRALLAGKSCVTSNKELVAKHGPELLEIAKSKQLNFLFEASVGGGIPIIRPLNQSLTADEIYEIAGVLNGTTNYILSKMEDEGVDFDLALKEAQELGYAERNPEADIEGYDACRKVAILSSLAFGRHVDYEDIYTEGITQITLLDMAYAKKMGLTIKLLGRCKKVEEQVYAMVAPVLLDHHHPLSGVNGVFNAILVKGNVIGEVMFYGPGAGKLPTASAVVADIIDAVKHKGINIVTKWSTKQKQLMPIEDVMSRGFIRLSYTNRQELEDHVYALFGTVDWIEIEDEPTIGFITEVMSEGQMNTKKAALGSIPGIKVGNLIRLES